MAHRERCLSYKEGVYEKDKVLDICGYEHTRVEFATPPHYHSNICSDNGPHARGEASGNTRYAR
jgi:hypothetical protein